MAYARAVIRHASAPHSHTLRISPLIISPPIDNDTAERLHSSPRSPRDKQKINNLMGDDDEAVQAGLTPSRERLVLDDVMRRGKGGKKAEKI